MLKWEQESLQEERAKLAKDEKRKQELVAKYGQKYAQDIIEGKPTIGMTKEMCLEACGGSPNKGITKKTTSAGEQEEWTYGLYSMGYIYIVEITFINGKITYQKNPPKNLHIPFFCTTFAPSFESICSRRSPDSRPTVPRRSNENEHSVIRRSFESRSCYCRTPETIDKY